MNNLFYGKTIKINWERLNLDLVDKSDTHRILNPQSKCSFDDKNAKFEQFTLCSFQKKAINFWNPFVSGLCLRIIKIYNVRMVLHWNASIFPWGKCVIT